ncbi:altronate dehydratase family protein [Leptolyngbya sp. 15MV]|nr:altronate dehydratase family protein [Leptolyngbya sp. 15MV]
MLAPLAAECSWLRADERDNVAVALVPLAAGSEAAAIRLGGDVPAGHKFALAPIAANSSVIKLGAPIGVACADIAIGEHVHDHNLACIGRVDRASIGTRIADPAPRAASFEGYRRADGRVGTRNLVGIVTSVNCSATVARRIAQRFGPRELARFPGVDGVAAFGHASGCGMAKVGDGIDNLRRTISGYARHPNFGGVLLVGLGCEVNQIDDLLAREGLMMDERLRVLAIQESGGSRAAIEAGTVEVEQLLAVADRDRRTTVCASKLTLGLQCGASDGYSALTANPALGRATDLLIGAGGAAILSETPEIYGAENLLLERTADPRIAHRLIERLEWWERHAAQGGADLDNNPSPGNRAGGITTILEKSLGAVAKSGSSPLRDVLRYGEQVRVPGLSFMDTPGYDPCSATGQIAGGANLIAFTTGRGSAFGSKPAPTLKLASNSDLAARMGDDIDLDCGVLLDGGVDHAAMGEAIFARLLEVASGRRTASEEAGMGDEEFVPWVPGPMF